MRYENVSERAYTLPERLGMALFMAIVWYLLCEYIFQIPNLGFWGGIVNMVVLFWTIEYSFEYKNGRLMIRSDGKHYELPLTVRILLWPIAKPFSLLGKDNVPILGYIVAGFYIYGTLFENWQIANSVFNLLSLYILYKLRKEDK